MKFRSDFVTNSSSSSFILSRKGDFSERQKEALCRFVEQNMLGKIFLTPENTEEEIQKIFSEHWIDEEEQGQMREALDRGETVYHGWVSFEETDYDYGTLFESIWSVLEENSDGNFRTISDDLSY